MMFEFATAGGSVIDAAKAVAAISYNPGELRDYLEVIGCGKPLSAPALPCVAVPTTAGTGAEVTRNAVLCAEEHGVKVSLCSPTMLPDLALVDPDLTLGLPPDVTAATGMDALTQLQARHPDHLALARYRETAVLLTGRPDAGGEEAVDWVRELSRRLGLPSLGALGFTAAQTEEAVSKAVRASSMQGNPVVLTKQELAGVYQRAVSFSA